MVSLSPAPLKPHCIVFFSLASVLLPSLLFSSLSLSPCGSWAGSLLAPRHLIGWVSLLFHMLISHSALLHCSGARRAQLHCLIHHQMLDAYRERVNWQGVNATLAFQPCFALAAVLWHSSDFLQQTHTCGENHKIYQQSTENVFLTLCRLLQCW